MLRLPPLYRGVRIVLFALAGAFVAQLVMQNVLGIPVARQLALTGGSTPLMWTWQSITYPLVDAIAGQASFLLTKVVMLFFLYAMLSPFEGRWGTWNLARLLLVATLVGAAAGIAVIALWPGGVTGAAYGTTNWFLAALAVVAATDWGGRIAWFGAFAMEAWQALLTAVILALLFALVEGSLLHLASSVGAIAGAYAYGRWLLRPERPAKKAKRRGRGPNLRVIDGGEASDERPRYLN